MFDLEPILSYLGALHPYAKLGLVMLGGLVILGQSYIAMTPTQKDDAWYAKLEKKSIIGRVLRALKSFAPIQRKDK